MQSDQLELESYSKMTPNPHLKASLEYDDP